MKSLFISKKGYTLIELLVVIGILAVLASIAIPSVAGLIRKSQATVDNRNAREMTNALERFASEYELYKEDLSMNQVDISKMDAMQGRVFSVVKTTNRSDFSKFEIGETDENLAYDNFYINKKTNYPLTEIGARRVLTSYLKTKVANFTPLRSDYSFYYSPECGRVVCAKTGSTYEEIEAVASVTEPYISMSSALVTRTPWSFETNQIGVNQWINLTVNDGKSMMDFNFANVATETSTDYTFLRGFHKYNDTLEKDLFFNGTTYIFTIDEVTNDKYLNVLAFAFDDDGNGTVYDHKLEIFDSQDPADVAVIKNYCQTWAGNWEDYISGKKAVQMNPNDIDGELEYIFDYKSNPEHALSHTFLTQDRYCTLYKTPVEVNKASFKYEITSEDTIYLYDYKQANNNTSDTYTFDELTHRYQKKIMDDGIVTDNILYGQGYCNGKLGYFDGWGPNPEYVREELCAGTMNFSTSIPENSIIDMRGEDDDENENNGSTDFDIDDYTNLELVDTTTPVEGTTLNVFHSKVAVTSNKVPIYYIKDEYKNYSSVVKINTLNYIYFDGSFTDEEIANYTATLSGMAASETGYCYIYHYTKDALTTDDLELINHWLDYSTIAVKVEEIAPGEISQETTYLFDATTTVPSTIPEPLNMYLNDLIASGTDGFIIGTPIKSIQISKVHGVYVEFYSDSSRFSYEDIYGFANAIETNLPTSGSGEKVIRFTKESDTKLALAFSDSVYSDTELSNIIDTVESVCKYSTTYRNITVYRYDTETNAYITIRTINITD